MIRSHEDRPLLEEELYENISIHYGGRSGHLDGSLEELSAARENSRTSSLLLVPPKYKRAYRMMTNIHPTFLAKFARKDVSVLRDSGSIRGGVYCPHVGLGTLMVSSWTVDPRMFLSSAGSLFYEPNRNGYAVVLVANLEAQRRKFFFNPDVLPQYIGLNEDLTNQREVLGVGKITLLRILYAAGQDTSIMRPSYDQHPAKRVRFKP